MHLQRFGEVDRFCIDQYFVFAEDEFLEWTEGSSRIHEAQFLSGLLALFHGVASSSSSQNRLLNVMVNAPFCLLDGGTIIHYMVHRHYLGALRRILTWVSVAHKDAKGHLSAGPIILDAVNRRDFHGCSPLWVACKTQDFEAARLLVTHGASMFYPVRSDPGVSRLLSVVALVAEGSPEIFSRLIPPEILSLSSIELRSLPQFEDFKAHSVTDILQDGLNVSCTAAVLVRMASGIVSKVKANPVLESYEKALRLLLVALELDPFIGEAWEMLLSVFEGASTVFPAEVLPSELMATMKSFIRGGEVPEKKTPERLQHLNATTPSILMGEDQTISHVRVRFNDGVAVWCRPFLEWRLENCHRIAAGVVDSETAPQCPCVRLDALLFTYIDGEYAIDRIVRDGTVRVGKDTFRCLRFGCSSAIDDPPQPLSWLTRGSVSVLKHFSSYAIWKRFRRLLERQAGWRCWGRELYIDQTRRGTVVCHVEVGTAPSWCPANSRIQVDRQTNEVVGIVL
jgi:hypothetical protein